MERSTAEYTSSDAGAENAPRDASSATAAPPADASTVRDLDPSIKKIWMIKIAGYSAFLVFGILFYDLTHFFGGSWLPFGVPTGVVLLLAGLYAFVWPRLRYRSWGFELRAEELYLEHGVLNHIRTIVPLRRVQHLDVSQDLLEREFGLGRLIVHTAGSRSSDVIIPGLVLAEAERIRDEVRRFILEDPLMEDPV